MRSTAFVFVFVFSSSLLGQQSDTDEDEAGGETGYAPIRIRLAASCDRHETDHRGPLRSLD